MTEDAPTAVCPAHGLPIDVRATHWLVSDLWLCPRCHEAWSARDEARLVQDPVAVMQGLWDRRRP